MTDRPAHLPARRFRTLAVSATACGLALSCTLGAGASPAAASGNPSGTAGGSTTAPASADTQASLQVQAQELAGEIEANGRTLDELDAAYNAAQIRLQSLDSQAGALQAGMAQTTARITEARQALKEQAVLAYLSGGAPLISYLPDQPGQDPSLTVSYAEIIAGGQKRAADTYRTELDSMTKQSAALASTQQQARIALASIKSDEASAAATLAEQQQALAQVKGQMAVLVAQVEQAQQNAAQATSAQLTGTSSPGSGRPPNAAAAPAQTPSAQNPSAQNPSAQNPSAPTSPAKSGPGAGPIRTTSTTAAHYSAPAYVPPTTRYVAPTAAPATTTAPASPTPAAAAPGGSTGAVPAQAPGASQVLAYARAQLGKPYQWAGAGPDSFDCSGLVMRAWEQASVNFPHLAQDQYDMTARIPISQALPGDLIFFGTPDNVYHVGIYIGNGQMIDAPETGQNVSVQSIYWDTLLGAGRVYS